MVIYFYTCELITPKNSCNYHVHSGFEVQTESLFCQSKKHATPCHVISPKTILTFSTFYLRVVSTKQLLSPPNCANSN